MSWVMTDDMQYLRKIEPGHYELIEANEVDGMFVISQADEVWVEPENDLQDDTLAIISMYYNGNYEEFVRLVPDPEDREQQIAEMLYECKSIFLIERDYPLLTEKQADFVLGYYMKHGDYPKVEEVLSC